MVRKVVDKTSFLGGEAGYLLEGRSDLAQFQLGASRIQNMIPLKSGPVTRRPGTRFVKATQGDMPARLIDWIISYDSGADMYVVELAQASSTSVTIRVIRVSDNTVYTPTGSPLTVATDFDLNEVQYAQVGGSLFIVHKSFEPQVLYRTAATPTFTIAPFIGLTTVTSRVNYESIPYMDSNTTAITLSIDVATTGTGRIVTASAAYFTANMVGAYFRMKATAVNGFFKVTGYTNSTTVTVEVVKAIDAAATATTNWAEGAWSTERGWPRAITFYNQRSVFGGSTFQPDTFWMSQIGDYFEMTGVNSSTYEIEAGVSDALRFTLASNRLNEIKWMVGGKKLTIGTGSSEWVGTVTNDGTNLFVDFDEETTHGSSYSQPRKISYSIPFIQRSRRTIRELNFNFDSDSYVATDLNLFGSHIGTSYGRFSSSNNVGIVQTAYQESPFGIMWAIDTVGRLYGLTRDIQQQIAAWHSHKIGGRMTETILTGLSGPDYPAFVTSICVSPGPNGDIDRLWMVVRRAIDGNDRYHVEYMDDLKFNDDISPGTTADIRAFLDCASIATGAASLTWNGYTRFAGESVYVIAVNSDGAISHAGLLTVSGAGVITLPSLATKVVVGLHADSEVRMLPSVGGSNPELTLLGAKGVDTAAIKLYQTWGLRIGRHQTQGQGGVSENTSFEPIPFDLTQTPIISTFTGVKEVQVPGDTDNDGSFALVMQEPWPCTILSISSRVVTNEV